VFIQGCVKGLALNSDTAAEQILDHREGLVSPFISLSAGSVERCHGEEQIRSPRSNYSG
jgi:hypothetical protein